MSEERLKELRRIADESVKSNSSHHAWFPTGYAWELFDEINRLREELFSLKMTLLTEEAWDEQGLSSEERNGRIEAMEKRLNAAKGTKP